MEQTVELSRPDLLDRDGLKGLANVLEAASRRVSDRVDESHDPYSTATAEFYDLLATGHWDAFGQQLRELFADVDPAQGPVVDVGVGTGVGLAHVLAAVPAAQIHAIEPSKAMRVALHARLSIDPALRAVTTVDPRSFAEAALPNQACALVASAVLGHLGLAERRRLWRYVAHHLAPGAPAVIELLPPFRPIEVPQAVYRRVPVGEYVYEGWQRGEPVDELHMSWTMGYRVLHGDDVVAEHEVASRWRCISPDDVRDEVAPFRLTATEHADCIVLTSQS